MQNLLASLQSNFGFSSFRQGQSEAIQSLLNGQDTLVVMPTGSGKSLVFQLAALHLPGLTLVISPLIALMKDQVDSLERRGIQVTFINSSMAAGEQNQRLRGMASGKYRVVYVSPERLRNTQFLTTLQQQKISLLAVDEAHCISEWGHDFRPDYLHIAKFRALIGNPLTAALTATATPRVQDDIARLLGVVKIQRIITGFNRPNLIFEVRSIANLHARLKAIQDLLSTRENGATIIYAGTRRDTEEVAEFVSTIIGIRTQHYHAGLPPEERTSIQDAFMNGKLSVVAATNAFGMGIDRSDVRQVIHYSLPGSLEAYYQEAGRAGRDELPAKAVLLYSPEDRALQEWFIVNSTLTTEDLHLLFNTLRPASDNRQLITYNDLSYQTGLPEVKVRVGLAELERAGALVHKGDEGFRIRVHLQPWNSKEIQAVIERHNQHQADRKTQLERMIAYAESNECRRSIILKHFGDMGATNAEVCCDNCQMGKPTRTKASDVGDLPQPDRVALIILDTVRRIPWGIGREKITQILKGSKAQDIVKFNYNKNIYYGRLAVFSMIELEQMVEQLLTMNYIKLVGGKFPIIRLTPQGEAAIRDKSIIPMKLTHRVENQTIDRKKAESQAGGTPDSDIDQMGKIEPASGKIEYSQVVELGDSRSLSAVSELVGHLSNRDGNIRRLAASALGKIGDKTATLPLMDLLAREEKPQVRQYAVKALGRIADIKAINLLQEIANSLNEKDYTREAAKLALGRLPGPNKIKVECKRNIPQQMVHSPEDPITAYLSGSHPRQLPGPWAAGWALDFHSQFNGADWNRSETGELAYRLKYQDDLSVIPKLVDQAAVMLGEHPELSKVDAVIPVPPSAMRINDPVSCFTKALSQRLGISFLPVLIKSRQTRPQKEMHTLAQKRVNVTDAFDLKSSIKGKSLLVVDDLFDSGATLEEIYHLLNQFGASKVYVMTITRTIHSDA